MDILYISWLTHWGQVMNTCIRKLGHHSYDNDLLTVWCQAIIWTNARLLFTGFLGTNFSKSESKYNSFHTRKWFRKYRLPNGSPFVLASMCSVTDGIYWWKPHNISAFPKGVRWEMRMLSDNKCVTYCLLSYKSALSYSNSWCYQVPSRR